ncbi:hypothetical protein [Agromyces sp. SYSU T00194]|uniref:hypothetical protein n=1 Tax=Agromyces chitinivorans TaxID=3158560 RepID=UPI00339657B8
MKEASGPGCEGHQPFAARTVSVLELLLAESLRRSRAEHYELPVRLVVEWAGGCH